MERCFSRSGIDAKAFGGLRFKGAKRWKILAPRVRGESASPRFRF
jgi:hypothetical protein